MLGVAAQTPQGPVPPTAAERQEIENRLTELASSVKALAASKADAALISDVDIYRKAAEYIVRFPEEFATEDFRGTNAWLYPRLADYSVVKANGGVALSAFFDEHWQVK